MNTFTLVSDFKPTGDQPEVIQSLIRNINEKKSEQTLLGVTGSGKTFTMANVIAHFGRPALIISHNKTLAAQLYQEFRDFFPKNSVNYFVSYYDFYQPEAYIPHTDTYIEKETEINEEIDKLRLAATTNLLTRRDTIIVASVSCIYNIGSPKEYGHFVLELAPGIKIKRESLLKRLVDLQYSRSDYGFHRGTFRVRGDTIDLFAAYEDTGLRIIMENDKIRALEVRDPVSGRLVQSLSATIVYPAKHYMTNPVTYPEVFGHIKEDMARQVKHFKNQGKLIEAQRIEQRVSYDLEMIAETGYVNGIENYSRYFDSRKPGGPPYTLFDYFTEAARGDWLLFIDESHMTVPQIRGMYNGDRSRKQTLVDYGFRLPAALDNRPLRFDEFIRRIPQTVYVSATPDEWELSRGPLVEQLIRPTGLVDPKIIVKPIEGQINDLMHEIEERVARHERTLVTTLTKRMAEDLAAYLEQRGIKVHYLHSDVQTLERSDILSDLRSGKYDVIVGINLLREGLDLPEVSLVAVLDADKEGFLRSRVSLIQTMGRAARHISGKVILYADTITQSMQQAIDEVGRRRAIQLTYNKTHKIVPKSISKPIRNRLVELKEAHEEGVLELLSLTKRQREAMTPLDRKKLENRLTKEMSRASRDLNFELAAQLRDLIASLSG